MLSIEIHIKVIELINLKIVRIRSSNVEFIYKLQGIPPSFYSFLCVVQKLQD